MKNKSIYTWVVVGLLWIVALLNYMDRQMLSTMQEAMKVDICLLYTSLLGSYIGIREKSP